MLQTPHTGMFETVCLERIQQFDDPIIPDDDDEVCVQSSYVVVRITMCSM